MVHFNCTMAHPCATMVHRTCTMVHYDIPWYILAQPQYNLLVTWHAMEYDGTFSYYHGTKFLHHGILWFTMVHPLLKYTIDYSIVCQNVGYHSTVYHAFIIVYFVPFTLWWICIMYLMFGTKGFKKKQTNKQKSHTHTKCFGCGIMFHYFLTTLLCLWNFYFRKILTILAANYIAGSIIPITLQYCIGRILAQFIL